MLPLIVMARAHHKSARKGHPRTARTTDTRTVDGGVYIGLVMIGVFGIGLFSILSSGNADAWRHGLLGYVIAVAFLVNLYAWRVCAGRTLAGWQQSLARLPLRCAGFGTRGGKPLAAAHGSDRAKMMLFVSIATSAVVIVGLTVWLIPS